MTMRIITNENKIFELIEEQTAQCKEKPKLKICLKGLDLSDKDKASIKSQIQALVMPELVKYQQAKLQETPIRKQRIPNKGAINVSLKGLPLPDEEIQRLESQVQQIIQREVPAGHQDTQSLEDAPLAEVCGCAWPFLYLCEPPGAAISLNGIDPLPPWNPDGTPLAVAAQLGPRDGVKMTISNGASSGLRPDQMWIGLTLRSNDLWAKEIFAWGACIGTVSWIRQERAGNNPVWMQISKNETNTIFFKKAGFLGVMTDVGHLDTEEQFWRLLGGNIVTFDWVCDNCVIVPS